MAGLGLGTGLRADDGTDTAGGTGRLSARFVHNQIPEGICQGHIMGG